MMRRGDRTFRANKYHRIERARQQQLLAAGTPLGTAGRAAHHFLRVDSARSLRDGREHSTAALSHKIAATSSGSAMDHK